MAGGQFGTFSAGSITQKIVSIALVGIAVATGVGTVTPNNQDIVPMTGAASATAAGSVAPGWGQALTGSASTSGIGSMTVGLRPTNIAGQVITPATGTMTAQGSGVTANISGVEATFSPGNVTGGTQAISGSVLTGAQGALGLAGTVALTGVESAMSTGLTGPAQGAVDTLITSDLGTVAQSMTVPLVGSVSTGAQGTLTVTGDEFFALTGSASVMSAGTLFSDKQFPLTGSSAQFAQGTFGAPGSAALAGSAISTAQGSVFLTNDRTFALIGASATVVDGALFASPLAFVAGLSISVDQQQFGPRNVALVGQEIGVGQGDVSPPNAGGGGYGGGDHHHKHKKRHQIKIGDRIFEGSKEHIEQIMRDLAQRDAKKERERQATQAPVVSEVVTPAKKKEQAVTAKTDYSQELEAAYSKYLKEAIARMADDDDAIIALIS